MLQVGPCYVFKPVIRAFPGVKGVWECFIRGNEHIAGRSTNRMNAYLRWRYSMRSYFGVQQELCFPGDPAWVKPTLLPPL